MLSLVLQFLHYPPARWGKIKKAANPIQEIAALDLKRMSHKNLIKSADILQDSAPRHK